jgi:hypothetical protein
MSAPRELAVVVRAKDLCVALPAGRVTRLVIADELPVLREGAPGLLDVAGAPYASWDLGELLGVGRLSTAWVLLAVPAGGADVRIALRTGPCVAVVPMPRWSALPPRAFVTRARAMERVFSMRDLGGEGIGLAVDLAHLFARQELEAAAAIQRGAAAS